MIGKGDWDGVDFRACMPCRIVRIKYLRERESRAREKVSVPYHMKVGTRMWLR